MYNFAYFSVIFMQIALHISCSFMRENTGGEYVTKPMKWMFVEWKFAFQKMIECGIEAHMNYNGIVRTYLWHSSVKIKILIEKIEIKRMWTNVSVKAFNFLVPFILMVFANDVVSESEIRHKIMKYS